MKRHMFVIFCSLAVLTGCHSAREYDSIKPNDGMPSGEPFGEVSDAEGDKLFDFARQQGLDLESKMQVVDAPGITNAMTDAATNALADVFSLSLKFGALDRNARAYGQMVYSALLNLGEGKKIDFFLAVMVSEPPVVRQRIRDFLYYALLADVPKAKREVELKKLRPDYPVLFPDDYQFGKDDPIFLNGRLEPGEK